MKMRIFLASLIASITVFTGCNNNDNDDDTSLLAPALFSPLDSATGQDLTLQLKWKSVDDATTYRVQVSTGGTFSSTVVDDSVLTDTSKTIDSLSPSTLYYWRVRAKNGGVVSVWSGVRSFTTQNINIVEGMVRIPGGAFQMGSTNGWSDEVPVHAVTVSTFYMDSTLVTQADYQAIIEGISSQTLKGPNPSHSIGDPRMPVDWVYFHDVMIYCNARSRRDGLVPAYDTITWLCDYSKNGYRLPTEAEWEYAARAGSAMDFYWGQSYPPITAADTAGISAHAWWSYNSSLSSHPVATKPPNAFGLYDMSGNVFEWCNDLYDSYSSESQINPTGPIPTIALESSVFVYRGGSWAFSADHIRSSCRGSGDATGKYCGFRCVRR